MTPERAARFIVNFDDVKIFTKEEIEKNPSILKSQSGPRSLDEIDREYREKQAKLAAEEEKNEGL